MLGKQHENRSRSPVAERATHHQDHFGRTRHSSGVHREKAARGKTLALDIDDTQDCDLTLAQLVIAARKSVAANGAKLKLAKPAAGNFLAVIERAGLLTGDKKQDDFWLEGKAI